MLTEQIGVPCYIADNPVACVALVSTWIGYQVSLLNDAFVARGVEHNPFEIFIASIPYSFYPILALTITLTVAVSGRDWGPMLKAERRARAGELLAPTAQPLADYESSGVAPEPGTPYRWFNAALPVLAVIVVTLVGLWHTGRQDLIAKGEPATSLRLIIGASDPFTVLLWASLIGLAVAICLAVGQGLLDLRQALEATVTGFKSMLMAMVVLILAWSLGGVCTGLATADFLVKQLGSHLALGLAPAAIFLVAAAISFATGTSWGTMAILTPLAIPLVLAAGSSPEAVPYSVLAAMVSAILGGSVFGDHCSPISDTTILSSMASGCDHVDHVRTQLPYALMGALAALVLGYLPGAMLGFSPWLLPCGMVTVVVAQRLLGQLSDGDQPPEPR
jgi:Na+/H+ antiporter NhaC